MEDFFDWIPLELVSHCLSFLPLKDLFNSALVCKKFYKATSDCLLWKAICERDLRVSQKLETMSWKDYYRMGKYIKCFLQINIMLIFCLYSYLYHLGQ